MENENKNSPRHQGERKNNHHRPKAYYIEPKQSAETSAEGRKESERPNNGGGQHNNKMRQSKGNRDSAVQSNQPLVAQPAANTQQSSPKGSEGDAPHRSGKNRHRNRHKPKHNSLEKPQTVEAESVDKAADNNRKPKKSYERPITKSINNEAPQINTDEYEAVHFPSISDENEAINPAVKDEPCPMVEVVGIRFKSSGKTYYFTPNGNVLKHGEHAIVETARGLEYGDVALGNTMVKESDTVPPLRPVVRAATPADVKRHEENKKKEDEAFSICNEKIIEHKLDMKLIDAQYTFDNSKLLFYFTSAGRVDFRDLVKDLAGVFRTRIELRQIGIRDEAKIMGGVGMCGRPLCCTLFLSDFGQVSIKMAKEQNLSLNCAKISGICGRLMCCLRYEHETYEYEIKRTPPVDSLVQTSDGTGTVTEISPLRGTVKVRLSASPETQPKVYRREDVVMLQKKAPKTSKQES